MAELLRQEAVEKVAEIEAQDSEGVHQEDRLSELPDDILMCILDRLAVLRDVARTSVLSKRWRHVVGLLTEITLSAADFESPVNGSKPTFDVVVQSNMDMVKAVTSILAHTSRRTIELLSLRFYLRDESIDIFRSVDHTMQNREVVKASFAVFPEMRDMIEHPQLMGLKIICCAFEKVELNWLPKLQLWTIIHGFYYSIWIQPEAPRQLSPLLQNLQAVILRHIHDECDLSWTMFFLEAAPLLKKIAIGVWNHICYEYEEDELKEYDHVWQQIITREYSRK
ncbi:hypothetical protein QOZ80_4AG0312640 [Eleusine coracana subsp. coracana]|nr:hypothetical protein QOZ80_4AG0312640 [Eleusine coracana subsp. coracana]